MAAARRWGPHGRGEEPGPRGSAHGARGARSPARARSLNSTARSSRAAVPQAVRSWQRRRAGALGVPLPHLESPGLSRPPAVSSSGVFLSFGGRASSPESAFSKPGEWPRAQGSRRRRGARRPPGGGCRGSSARRALSSLQTAWVGRKPSILSLSPALTPSFFPVLQILGSSSSGNAGRKLAREGGGGWKFLAAPLWCVYGAGGSRWVG